MKILRLQMTHWRGVRSRELRLADGVTVIEGPNEIGKSSIVEAIGLLFGELDSSKKQAVKAIKPVDQDVGSSIEAEIIAGENHFIYAKTFNKATQTRLNILKPSSRQMTGRAAHEHVEQLLESTVDMGLWKALLVDQGDEVRQSSLQDSHGLARALDEAAGASTGSHEDSGLIALVQQEYERYFTLKTGKSKFIPLAREAEQARSDHEAARDAVDALETSTQQFGRVGADLRRLQSRLPQLRENLDALNEQWSSVSQLRETLQINDKDLAVVEDKLRTSTMLLAVRQRLIQEIEEAQSSLHALNDRQQPERQRSEAIRQQLEQAQTSLEALKSTRNAARMRVAQAERDHQQLQEQKTLEALEERQQQFDELTRAMTESIRMLAVNKVSDEAITQIRDAERQLVIAQQTRDAAATTVTVTAESSLVMTLDGDSVALQKHEKEKRTVAKNLSLKFPGLAKVTLEPPSSVANLDEELSDASDQFAELLKRHDATSLNDALNQHENRRAAQQASDRIKQRKQDILGQQSIEEIAEAIAAAKAQWDRHLEDRDASTPMPATLAEASTELERARSAHKAAEEAVDEANEHIVTLQARLTEMDRDISRAEQELASIQAILSERQQRLEAERAGTTDETLKKRVRQASDDLKQLQQLAKDIERRLADATPDAIETRRRNAEQVLSRAQDDLKARQTEQAVLTDRLQQAQADGRFEAMTRAKHTADRLEQELKATQRRAAAAECLWLTMSTHRDASRKAYVKPLKDAIERLGHIVFGPGFEVEVGEDWSLIGRTLDGVTLPFEDLSIGAREQLGILTRLAAAQIVSSQGGVPLIIDDALGFSDPMRLETMGAAIAEAGKDCQIIILTCSPDRFMHIGSAQVIRL